MKQHQTWKCRTPDDRQQEKCDTCQRVFRRESYKARHKCKSEWEKPVNQQRGSVQCQRCEIWFCSKGGLAVHRCKIQDEWQHDTLFPMHLQWGCVIMLTAAICKEGRKVCVCVSPCTLRLCLLTGTKFSVFAILSIWRVQILAILRNRVVKRICTPILPKYWCNFIWAKIFKFAKINTQVCECVFWYTVHFGILFVSCYWPP